MNTKPHLPISAEPMEIVDRSAGRPIKRQGIRAYMNMLAAKDDERVQNLVNFAKQQTVAKTYPKLVTFNRLSDVPVHKYLGMKGGGKSVKDVKFTYKTLKSKV